jgi:hypothetical protein
MTAEPERFSRERVTLLDGVSVFGSVDDAAAREVAAAIADRWGCELRSFGIMSPIDFYAVRAGRVAGFAEIKCRSHGSATYPTVYLSVRKWLALLVTSTGMGCPAIFVVRFTDGIYWVGIERIDPRRHLLGGHANPRQPHDVEPLIHVPVAIMRRLDQGPRS